MKVYSNQCEGAFINQYQLVTSGDLPQIKGILCVITLNTPKIHLINCIILFFFIEVIAVLNCLFIYDNLFYFFYLIKKILAKIHLKYISMCDITLNTIYLTREKAQMIRKKKKICTN